MNRNEFFEKIRNKGLEEEYLIELLRLRGFLIDQNEKECTLSNNSHKEDACYLDELLKYYEFGYVKNTIIYLNSGINGYYFEEEFKYGKHRFIEDSTGCKPIKWNYFATRKCAFKVCVSELEPFIARYIKAISSCGVFTNGSCDGNHKEIFNRPDHKKVLLVQFCGYPSFYWHYMMWEKCLTQRFDIKWENNYSGVPFSENEKYNVYYEINKVAEYVYKNRELFRKIKQEALQGIASNQLRKMPEEKIEKIFKNRLEELFDKYSSMFN